MSVSGLIRQLRCGYLGGCNNISLRTPPIDTIQVTAWPARIVVWFWQDDPGAAIAEPDMTFVIRFK